MTSGSRDPGRPGLRRFYRGLAGRLPPWAALGLGVAAVALGAAITFAPLRSIGVLVALIAAAFVITGIGELSSAGTRLGPAVGWLWIVAGIVVAAMPGAGIGTIALAVGAVLLVGGLLKAAAALRRGTDVDERLIAGLSGASRAIFGVLALSWPDISLLVLGLLVGPAIILFGLGQIAGVLRGRREARSGGNRWPAWIRLTGAAASLLLALGLLSISRAVRDSSAEPGAFYEAPAEVPDRPGVLIRSEPFARGMPEGARAWRILYTTTRDDRTSALAGAIVVVADEPPPGPRPVIAWAHGTTGVAPSCAPSLLKDPLAAGAMPAVDQVVANGWVLVATDYVGLGTEGPHPYLIGDPEARSVLDAARAVRQLVDVQAGPQTVVWGHSQGGGAALWTGILAPRYAPDAGVIGVAALAPATRLPALFDAVKDSPVGRIMGSYVVSAYSETYPDVSFDDYIRPAARVLARETAGRCLSGPEALISVGTAVGEETYFSRSPASGALGARLEENIPTGPIEAPLLIAQGLTDALVLPHEQRGYVDERCAAGQRLEYRTYAGFDHVGLVLDPTSPLPADLVAWTRERIAGSAPPDGCPTVSR